MTAGHMRSKGDVNNEVELQERSNQAAVGKLGQK